jgi:Trp operon repressor
MGRGQAAVLVVACLCALALVAVGARYYLVRDQRIDTEQTVAKLKRQTSAALDLLRDVQTVRRRAEASNVMVAADRDRVRAAAALLHADLSQTQAATTAAGIAAYTSGVAANNLRACLTGVSQALNQLAVGDRNSIKSLAAVEAPCRAVGVT